MVPNLDLFLVALLHGSFISFVLIIIIFIILIAILCTFFITLFSILVIDAYDYSSYVSQLFVTIKAHLELFLVLVVFSLTYAYVLLELKWKDAFKIKVSKLKKKLQVAFHQVDKRKVH